jgi:thiamine biosynthesis lipoprotein
LLFAAMAAGCGGPPASDEATPAATAAAGPHLVQRTDLAMGSAMTLTAWTSNEAEAQKAFDEVFAEFDRLDRLMSVWKPESEISKLNAAAGEHPVQIGPDVEEAIGAARQVSEWTEGKFDITFGALADVWKFDQEQDGTVPTPQQIAVRLPFIDYTKLTIDKTAHTAFLARKGMRAHLGGIGKGYGVDRAVAILRRHGIVDFMVQAGGDMYVGGKRGDRPWRLGINDPRGAGGDSFATIELSDETFSTSGDYERFFMKDGVRYHHIIDPDVGQPARGCRSVTIVSKRAVLADGLSTGVFILGPEKGMALIERLPDVEGVIVTAKNEVLVSSGLKGRLTLAHQPADSP